MVGTGTTSTNAPSDAAVVLVKGTAKALAITTDCNSKYVFADPYKGAMIAVSEAARNIVCSGGLPLGITNCLNFGNPYDPEVYYQFVHAIKGMGEACRKFDTPVTGGNVSFYNQNPDGAVYPTPTIGMVGLLENVNQKMTLGFQEEGDHIFLVGKVTDDINSSEYLHKIQKVEFSPAPYFELEEEFQLQQKIAALIQQRFILSAHDISEGGLITTLLEAAFVKELGFDVRSGQSDIRKDAYWFGEGQSRVVVTVKKEQLSVFKELLNDVPYTELGVVTASAVIIDGDDWGTSTAWKEKYDHAIEHLLAGHESEHALSAI
jgi:phosphoribosylformylglycinamidine synthase